MARTSERSYLEYLILSAILRFFRNWCSTEETFQLNFSLKPFLKASRISENSISQTGTEIDLTTQWFFVFSRDNWFEGKIEHQARSDLSKISRSLKVCLSLRLTRKCLWTILGEFACFTPIVLREIHHKLSIARTCWSQFSHRILLFLF